VSKRRGQAPPAQCHELKLEHLAAVLERGKSGPLSDEDFQMLKAALDTLAFLTQELEAKGASIKRLRQMLFGAKTEKTSQVLGKNDPPGEGENGRKRGSGGKRPGHGRIGANAYPGAKRVQVVHPSLHGGDRCPACTKGKVYEMKVPARLVRVTGMPPLTATVYECDRLRCNLCGEVYTAPTPEGVGEEKYDERAVVVVGLLKYDVGMPFHRNERLQASMGVPLPAGTQWELVKDGAQKLAPVHEEMTRQAAQAELLHNDDTTMKVLELMGRRREADEDEGKGCRAAQLQSPPESTPRASSASEGAEPAPAAPGGKQRKGVFTSGIVAMSEGKKIALFITGTQHAGENLADVLAKRAAELPPPIQMCDALSQNTAGDFNTILANCMAHARRKYVEVAELFPQESLFVLETLRAVYKNDAVARERGLTAEERLQFHQAESGPLMEDLAKWMQAQLDERRVEPNSGLGAAIAYMRKHWKKLTLFLRVPGAPLDNNICERALKKAILLRKGAYFYRTLLGARVGDCFMSLSHTAALNGVPAFEYLVELLRHYKEIAKDPAAWMPWNFRETLARLRAREAEAAGVSARACA